MKRLCNSDSSGSLMTICPSTEEHNNRVYGGREFQSMMLEGLDEEGCVEEPGYHSEKKRRLSVDQVKALEKSFEVENKLEPERKVKLAQELGLQPRQVAVWFQNRRARWKTKQLERDYGVLKANYEALKVNFDALNQNNEELHKQIKELKTRLQVENTACGGVSVKKEIMEPESEEDKRDPSPETSIPGSSESKDHLNYKCINNNYDVGAAASLLFTVDFKDGSSDSDTSAVLNEDNYNSPKAAAASAAAAAAISSSGVLQSQHFLLSAEESSPMNCCFQYQKQPYHAQYVKTEEHNFVSADEACNFFSDEQAPSLHWYCSDQWS